MSSNAGFAGVFNSISKAVGESISKITESFKLAEVNQNEYKKAKILHSTEDDLIKIYHLQQETIGVKYEFFDVVLLDKFNPEGLWYRLARSGSEEDSRKYFEKIATKLTLFIYSSRKTYKTQILQTLLDQFRKNEKWTAARTAIEIGFFDIFTEPGSKFATNPKLVNQLSEDDGLNCLMAAILAKRNEKILIKDMQNLNKSKFQKMSLEMVEFLLQNQADIELINTNSGESCWHYAINSEIEKPIQMLELISRYASSVNINKIDHNGKIPIGLAVEKRDLEICKLLRKNNAKWHVDMNRPPVHLAVKHDAIEVLELILQDETDIDIGEGLENLSWPKSGKTQF